jgi:hypothetical protein
MQKADHRAVKVPKILMILLITETVSASHLIVNQCVAMPVRGNQSSSKSRLELNGNMLK